MTKQQMTKQDKKKALVQWLDSFITQAYYKQLQTDKKQLEQQLVHGSRTNFITGEVIHRGKDEVEIHINLAAIDLNLNMLIPLFEFKEWCEEQDVEILDVPHEYERVEVGREGKIQYTNPLDLFINEL